MSFSQSENEQLVFDHFKENYNLQKFDAIFNSFSVEMQQALPVKNCNQFFSGLFFQAGKISEFSFQNKENEQYAVYKTTFERGTFLIYISADSQNKINGLLVKPYVEPSKITLINNLSTYPKEIAELIFSNTKDFPNNTQLSIAVINKGIVQYYGVQILNETLSPIENQNKIFEIGSLSKVFTSTVLANLVIEGKLKLNDKINAYYPFLFKNKSALTFESLANHTSGLPRLPVNLDVSDTENPYKNCGPKEMDYYLMNQMQLTENTDKLYNYSNLGAGLLGYTLGISQKTTLSELLSTTIFKKYKMNNSVTNSHNLGSKLVRGLDADGEPVSNWDFDVLLGAGGILSTTSDLVLFAKAHFNSKNKELELTRTAAAVVNDEMKIGLGWHLLQLNTQNNFIWHNGGTGGYSSSMVLDVKNKNGVIILSNVSGLTSKNKKIDDLAFELVKNLK